MAEDIWYSVDLPILEALHEYGGPRDLVSVGDVAEWTGLDPAVVAGGIERLETAVYLGGSLRKLMSGDDPSPWFLENSSLADADFARSEHGQARIPTTPWSR